MKMLAVFDPSVVVAELITAIGASLTTIAPQAGVLGAGIVALFFGWRLVRKFVG